MIKISITYRSRSTAQLAMLLNDTSDFWGTAERVAAAGVVGSSLSCSLAPGLDMAAAEEDPPGYVEAEVRDFFDQFDGDGSGNINPDEFRQLCEQLRPGMEEEEMDQALEALDADGDGEISYDGASRVHDRRGSGWLPVAVSLSAATPDTLPCALARRVFELVA